MSSSTRTKSSENITIRSGRIRLEGVLAIPESPLGVVLFAHGSGSGRFSPRNNFVARQLQESSLATLLIDLLDPAESEDRQKVFDIDLLADRLLLAKAWLAHDPRTIDFRIGYFGASTGAGAALRAASLRERNRHRARRDSLVRGARDVGAGGHSRLRLVPAPFCTGLSTNSSGNTK